MENNKNYCVYKHINLETNKTFYIGKGLKTRPYSKFHRNKYWNNIVNKFGYKIHIIKNNLTNVEACDLEYKLICLYKRYNLAEANLNTDYGIGGRLGRTDEDYELIGKKVSNKTKGTRAGEKNPNFNKEVTLQTRNKISRAKKGNRKGISQSKEHIINKANSKKKKNSKYQYWGDL